MEEINKMNLYERLSAITNEIPVVEKNLDVVTGIRSYKAVSERDILDAVKEMEEKYRIYSYPHERTLETLSIPEGKSGTWIRVTVIYRFINIDNPQEFIDIKSYGDGIDSMDKAPGKAMTYADKYALMKAYKISTGDDPDQESNESLQESLTPSKQSKNRKQNVKLATPQDIEQILKVVEPNRIPGMLKAFKKNNLNELTSVDVEKILLKAELEAKAKAETEKATEEETKADEKSASEVPAESVAKETETLKVEQEVKPESKPEAEAKNKLATAEQLGEITRLLEPERIPKMLKAYKKNSLEELSYVDAEKVLKRARKEAVEKANKEAAEKV